MLTEHTQPAILTHSAMVMRAYEEWLPAPNFVAGHSLGEYSALVANRALSFADAVRIVRERGRAMQLAVPVGVGAMAAIIGLDTPRVEAACAQASERCGEFVLPANYNCPGQIVISGHRKAVEAAMEIVNELGCLSVTMLPVSAPFHTPLMEPARIRMVALLGALPINSPRCPLVNNVDAAVVSDAEELRSGLLRQICGAVRWSEQISVLLEQGVTTFYELGPGKILASIVNRQAKLSKIEITIRSVSGPEDLSG
jgi:[acyl-carrier-protein] S-malonyltransferase